MWCRVPPCRKDAQGSKEEGNRAYHAGDLDLALELYSRASSINPDRADITFKLDEAAVHLEKKNYHRTIEVCTAAVELGRSHNAAKSRIAEVRGRPVLVDRCCHTRTSGSRVVCPMGASVCIFVSSRTPAAVLFPLTRTVPS